MELVLALESVFQLIPNSGWILLPPADLHHGTVVVSSRLVSDRNLQNDSFWQ